MDARTLSPDPSPPPAAPPAAPRTQVSELLQASLVAQGSQRADLSRTFLDGLVLLMRDCHAVREVMAAVDGWSASADPSLVRHLILQVRA